MNDFASPAGRSEPTVDYETLLQRCADKAYGFALRLTGNDQDAQDVVQEAFARAFEHRDRYDPNRPFEAWLNRILHNVFLDTVRRYEYKHKVSLDAAPPFDDEGSWSDLLAGKDREPVEFLVRSEDERRLQEALVRLPIHYRTAVTLYDLQGMSYDEIATIMKCPIGTVCSRIHQGRLLLKRALDESDGKGETVKSHGRTS